MSDVQSNEGGTRYRTRRFVRWYECTMCNHTEPEDKMGFVDGKPYCNRFGCYEEAIDRKIQRRK